MRARFFSVMLGTLVASWVPAIAQAQPTGPTPTDTAVTSETMQIVRAGPPFDVTGSVVSLRGNTMEFVTSDITGLPLVIAIDASDISRRNINVGDSLTLTIGPRVNDIPKAWTVLRQGSQTIEADFGARAEFETTNDTAEVENRPDDDEARAKQKQPKGKED